MNEKIDLTKILKDCPNGFELYSTLCGTVLFREIDSFDYPVKCECRDGQLMRFTKEGYFFYYQGAECLLFPSKDQRDWSKFTAPWHKKDKFDPQTLRPFDKVLARFTEEYEWGCALYSHRTADGEYVTTYSICPHCIPYNDETKHLVGTTDEAPEYYRYWED